MARFARPAPAREVPPTEYLDAVRRAQRTIPRDGLGRVHDEPLIASQLGFADAERIAPPR